ncbi:MerR family transcriptional regulator [Streptomyces sp. NBC_01455]|uniref:MerR family transcriptional regulator n=1 Tax=Streptomyces sp. NBC_01455 TaxID=2903874 RepID=UPI002E30295B|nr:MerR family transcriptional regulator [Streptomyces sp. NBC_01455]
MQVSEQAATRPTDAGVTTGSLARKLGVSPTTLRSWDRRYGIGPAQRTDGRHRRWTADDVAMLQEMCRFTAAGLPPAEAARAAKERARGRGRSPALALVRPPAEPRAAKSPPATVRPAEAPTSRSGTGLPLGDVRQECRGLARAAVRLDAAAVQSLLTAVVETHGLATAWDEVMAPTLRAVGRKWESSGDRYVEVEHLLSWHISATLRHVYVCSVRKPRTGGPPVLLACLPDEPHTLPLEALGAVLTERGVPALMLGGAVPAEALAAAVRRVGPSAVVLWAQSRTTANLPLARHVAGTRWGVRGARTRSLVLLGGPGWDGDSGPGLPRPLRLDDALRMLGAPEH